MAAVFSQSRGQQALTINMDSLRRCLDRALCIRRQPSALVERCCAPEVEAPQHGPPLLLQPMMLDGGIDGVRCCIEPSINAVRVSFAVSAPHHDPLGQQLMKVRCIWFELGCLLLTAPYMPAAHSLVHAFLLPVMQGYLAYLMQRADTLDLLRRVPVAAYDVSLLITDAHVLLLGREAILDFVCGLLEQVCMPSAAQCNAHMQLQKKSMD